MKQKFKIINKLTTYLFYISILIFLVAFNFQDSKTGGWVQQFLPNLPGNPPLLDITFADSLVGYAVTDKTGDTSYVLKTTNGGDNWFVNLKRTDGLRSYRLQCLSKDTVYFGAYFSVYKTFNGGLNWTTINIPGGSFVYDLFVLNKDTIWYTGATLTSGGLWRTTNAGTTWDVQYSGASIVDKIYMYNSRIGFMSAGTAILKTTNSGDNWFSVSTNDYFYDIYFVDSLKGYNANPDRPYSFNKTTNGGLNWQSVPLPYVAGSSNTYRYIRNFSYINDTIYGVYSFVRYNIQYRALIYKSTNGGLNWGYQIPDTSFNIPQLLFTNFINSKQGWCYREYDGITTYTGGDTTIMGGINSITNIVPKDYVLYQNYPNPFNQCSIINVQLQIAKNIKLNIYDISGKLVKTLINQKESSGTHSYKFDGGNLSSGIYLYTLFVDGNILDTKKAVIIK